MLVIISQIKDTKHQLMESHIFWISAGIFCHCGLVSLLLFVNEDVNSEKGDTGSEFGTLYTVITIIKFIFFSIGTLVYKKLGTR
jgi:hypothetical protein